MYNENQNKHASVQLTIEEIEKLKREDRDFNLEEFIKQADTLHEYAKLHGDIKF